MKTFPSPQSGIEWADEAEGKANYNDRVHGPFSYLAVGRLGITQRFTIGNGLIDLAERWKAKKAGGAQ